MFRTLATVACLLVSSASLFADSEADAAARRALIGRWTETNAQGIVSDQTFTEDGGYLAISKPWPNHDIRMLFEGTWQVSDGKIHFEVTLPDPRMKKPSPISYSEKILSFTDDTFRYEPSDKPGETAEMTRVRDKVRPVLASDIIGTWKTTYETGPVEVTREMTFAPFGLYFENSRLLQTDSPEPIPYLVRGTWRVRENLFIVRIDKTTFERAHPEKALLWAEVESIEGGEMKMRPFNGGGWVKATWYDRDALLPTETDNAMLTARAAVDHLFGVPVIGTLPEALQERVHARLLHKAPTSLLIGMHGMGAVKKAPELDPKGRQWGNDREHNATLPNSALFSRWGITANFGRVRKIEFSGPGEALSAGDVELSFEWLERTLGDATKSFAQDWEPEQKGYEAIGAYWAKPEALIVLSFHVGNDELYTSLDVYPASRDLEQVRNMKGIVYGEGTPTGRKALHGNWAREIAKLPE